MKLSKKALVTVFLLTVCFTAVFAQYTPDSNLDSIRISPKSMTNASTKEIFGTDVDDYLDVNEWSNVKPGKLFGFLSYGDNGQKDINTGFAAPVGKFYLSGFFGGQLNSWTSTKTTEKDGKDKNETKTKTDTTNTASGSILFGFDNIGIMGNITYNPATTTNDTTTNSLTKGITTHSNFNLETALKAGMNIKGPKDIVFKTSAELALASQVRKTIIKATGSSSQDLTDNSKYTLQLNGGVGFDFAHNGPVTQGASFDLNTAWNIYPTVTRDDPTAKQKTEEYGKLHDKLELKPAWQITYEPEESKVVLKAKVAVPVAFNFDNEVNYTKTTTSGTTTTAYTTSRHHQTGIGFTPELNVGLTYAPISKFRFNFGAKVHVPTFGWTIETTKHRKGGDGTLTTGGTDRTVTWEVKTNTDKIEIGTGFTWLITQNITFDAYWGLGDNVLKNTFGLKAPVTHSNIWETIDKLLTYDIGLLLSVKL